MRSYWIISEEDIKAVKLVYNEYKSHRTIKIRTTINIGHKFRRFTKELLWTSMFRCLLSSQQKSGKGSRINKFIDSKTFKFTYLYCIYNKRKFEKEIAKELSDAGIRFGESIANHLKKNLEYFETGYWSELFSAIDQLSKVGDQDRITLERSIADELRENIHGFGPKQSRNFLQELGLTCYELPIDSRIIGFFKSNLGWYITASGLSDLTYYHLVSDSIQTLCKKADIIPCLLDAAIFAHQENK